VNRLGVHQIDATGTRDGTTYLRGDGAWAAVDPAPTTETVLLTTTVGGSPELVWDDNDEIVLMEVPL
jgi:hypothetical protein